ncbi:MAG: hypothetical protein MK224_01365 [Candidatus Nitrosopelagicus sp.]|nr:hypothetical protein [Candidatus Nitrosopelagicus sp.]
MKELFESTAAARAALEAHPHAVAAGLNLFTTVLRLKPGIRIAAPATIIFLIGSPDSG